MGKRLLVGSNTGRHYAAVRFDPLCFGFFLDLEQNAWPSLRNVLKHEYYLILKAKLTEFQ